MITKYQLKKIMPRISEKKLDLCFPFLVSAMEQYEINTVLRMSAFLAQLGHESMDLVYMEEIASGEAYEGREDLGNVNPGDGKRYKGRGPIQLTGRKNYVKYGELLGLDLIGNPEQAATPEVGFQIAALYWKLNGLNSLADSESFKSITRKINGGYIGLEDRTRRYIIAKDVLRNIHAE